MKKLFAMACLVLVSVLVQAEPLWYRATALTLRTLPNGTWRDWNKIDVPVVINFDTKHIEVKSEASQIFDYVGFSVERIDNCSVYGSYATDSHYVIMYLEIYLYDSGLSVLKITYNNVEYKYIIESYKE